MHVPHKEMGEKAARILTNMVKGLPTEPQTELQATIKIRETLGEANSKK